MQSNESTVKNMQKILCMQTRLGNWLMNQVSTASWNLTAFLQLSEAKWVR